LAVALVSSASCVGPVNHDSPKASADTELSKSTIGVNAVTLRLGATRAADIDAIKSRGFPIVRVSIEWPRVEPQPGQFDWRETDSIVRGLRAHGLRVLGNITYTPSWAAAPEGRLFVHPGPADPATFAAFARAAASRYRGEITMWELWNEPNIQASFAPAPDVAKFAAMLRATYPQLKAID